MTKNMLLWETKAIFCSPMAVVNFAQHTWSERGRDDGASRLEKSTIYNAEFFANR